MIEENHGRSIIVSTPKFLATTFQRQNSIHGDSGGGAFSNNFNISLDNRFIFDRNAPSGVGTPRTAVVRTTPNKANRNIASYSARFHTDERKNPSGLTRREHSITSRQSISPRYRSIPPSNNSVAKRAPRTPINLSKHVADLEQREKKEKIHLYEVIVPIGDRMSPLSLGDIDDPDNLIQEALRERTEGGEGTCFDPSPSGNKLSQGLFYALNGPRWKPGKVPLPYSAQVNESIAKSIAPLQVAVQRVQYEKKGYSNGLFPSHQVYENNLCNPYISNKELHRPQHDFSAEDLAYLISGVRKGQRGVKDASNVFYHSPYPVPYYFSEEECDVPLEHSSEDTVRDVISTRVRERDNISRGSSGSRRNSSVTLNDAARATSQFIEEAMDSRPRRVFTYNHSEQQEQHQYRQQAAQKRRMRCMEKKFQNLRLLETPRAEGRIDEETGMAYPIPAIDEGASPNGDKASYVSYISAPQSPAVREDYPLPVDVSNPTSPYTTSNKGSNNKSKKKSDPVDEMIQKIYKMTNCVVPLRKINQNFYKIGDLTFSIQLRNQKLLAMCDSIKNGKPCDPLFIFDAVMSLRRDTNRG